VRAVLSLRAGADPGTKEIELRNALAAFLHPLYGNDSGEGWSFGEHVYVSDVALLLEANPGVNCVTELLLEVNGSPVGDVAVVPANRIVVAGQIQVFLSRRRAPTLA